MTGKIGRRTIKEHALVEGLEDWNDPGWIWGLTRELPLAQVDRRDLAIGVAVELIIERLVVPGDLIDSRHVAWSGKKGEAIERIVSEWLTDWSNELPTPGAIVLLQNTPEGDEIAHAVLRREGFE